MTFICHKDPLFTKATAVTEVNLSIYATPPPPHGGHNFVAVNPLVTRGADATRVDISAEF